MLVSIADSRDTRKRGTDVVIGLLTSDRRYKEGNIRLRRIRGQSVDSSIFKEVGPIDDYLGNCKELFPWEGYA